MSDTSSSSFSELKDNESTGSTSIPINTSLTGVDKPLPTTVAKPDSIKKATLSSDYSTLFIPSPHPSFTFDWFLFYLKQTRVLVILGLLIFSLILVIWIASLGKAGNIGNSSSALICGQDFAGLDLVPNVISTCPPAKAEIYYGGSLNGAGGVRLEGGQLDQSEVSLQPLAFFVPNPVGGYYYTAVFMDIDYRADSAGFNLRGVVTNLRLGTSIDARSGEWVFPYEGPSTTSGELHRYVWLVYRHSSATSGLEVPNTASSNFRVEDWFGSNWSQRPTLAAAAWFTSRSSR